MLKITFFSSFLCVLVLFAFNSPGSAYLTENDGWIQLDLQHSLSPSSNDFSYRGNVTIPSLNSGLANILQNPFTTEEIQSLKVIAQKNGFYRLKATVMYPNGVKRSFYTANKACSLILSDLNDELWISIDGNGFVNAISLNVPEASAKTCSSQDVVNLAAKTFNTDVLIKHTELAPIPDTASFIQKIEREREARERGETKDNRGFFAKYWMYIVPVVLLVFISGAANPEQK